MDKKFYVYAHIDPRDQSIRYIGKGTGDRAWRLTCRVAKHGSWIKSLKIKGLLPEIKILEYFDKEENALSKERELIKHFLSVSDNFCNMIDGGIGCPAGASHPMFGKKHSEKTRAKMSKASRGKPKTPEHRKNIGLGHKGKKLSTEHIRKRVEKTSKKVFCVENNTIYNSAKEAGIALDIDHSSVIRMCKGKQKTSWNNLTLRYFHPIS